MKIFFDLSEKQDKIIKRGEKVQIERKVKKKTK